MTSDAELYSWTMFNFHEPIFNYLVIKCINQCLIHKLMFANDLLYGNGMKKWCHTSFYDKY